jgi:hypothetical protein
MCGVDLPRLPGHFRMFDKGCYQTLWVPVTHAETKRPPARGNRAPIVILLDQAHLRLALASGHFVDLQVRAAHAQWNSISDA